MGRIRFSWADQHLALGVIGSHDILLRLGNGGIDVPILDRGPMRQQDEAVLLEEARLGEGRVHLGGGL